MPRIHWTQDEIRTVVRTAKEVKAGDKGMSYARMMELAQLSIPPHRRRQIKAITGQRPELLSALAAEGLISVDTGPVRAKPLDPNLTRINQLADERDKAIESLAAAEQRIGQLNEEVTRLRAAVRSEAEVVKGFVSDILATALQRVEDSKKPQAVRLEPIVYPQQQKEEIPEWERERRRDPTPKPTGNGAHKVKVAIVGGSNPDHAAILREVQAAGREDLDLRFFGGDLQGSKADAVKGVASTGGRVLLWIDHAPHEAGVRMNSMKVGFERYSGNLNGLIEKVKGTQRR
jgi:hypothetical protein